jgi:acetyl esterase/lipase
MDVAQFVPRMANRSTRLVIAAAGALTIVVWSTPASAQDWHTYATVRNPGQYAIDWRAFYERAQALTDAARAALPNRLDIPYGDDPKQRLDLYMPKGTVSRAPVFLFIHGGGFVEGDRRQYGFVATPLAAHGIITAVMSYRLSRGSRSTLRNTGATQVASSWAATQPAPSCPRYWAFAPIGKRAAAYRSTSSRALFQ